MSLQDPNINEIETDFDPALDANIFDVWEIVDDGNKTENN